MCLPKLFDLGHWVAHMTLETEFTPVASFCGGVLIGLAAVLLMAYRGRILGATGVFTGLIFPDTPNERSWRLALLTGMFSGPVVVSLWGGATPDITLVTSLPWILIGGVVVGCGVTLGSGCTSGHGVCGLARLSLRSFVAVLTFMTTAAITVYIMRHVLKGV